jgi:hypothetical protein
MKRKRNTLILVAPRPLIVALFRVFNGIYIGGGEWRYRGRLVPVLGLIDKV